jgi:transcriptional regulator with XRE-family HTH domain
MKIKNYRWEGFGFPIIFEELPATKIRGELMPDVDWSIIGKMVAVFICGQQDAPLSGDQVKFIRNMMNSNLREFATFAGVKHPSVMRWEENGDKPAKIETHIEIFLRLKVLKYLGVKLESFSQAFDHAQDIEKFKAKTYKHFKPVRVPESVVSHP